MTRVALVGASGYIGRGVRSAAPDGLLRIGRNPADSDVSLETLLSGAGERAFGPVAAVLNVAGATTGDLASLREANVELVRRLLRWCSDRGVPLITLGSAAEYGPPTDAAPLDEESVERPASDYGRSKLEATELVRAASAMGQPAVVARLFNVAGPGLPCTQPLGEFVSAVDEGPPGAVRVTVRDADTRRDYVTLPFAARALLTLAALPHQQPVVNVASGRSVSFRELIEALGADRGREIDIHETGPSSGIREVIGAPGRLTGLTGLAEHASAAGLAAATRPA